MLKCTSVIYFFWSSENYNFALSSESYTRSSENYIFLSSESYTRSSENYIFEVAKAIIIEVEKSTYRCTFKVVNATK